MDKTCKSCGWWEREYFCDDARRPLLKGTCHCDKFINSWDQETPVNGIGYYGTEIYGIKFETGEAFGCIHYVPINREEICAGCDKVWFHAGRGTDTCSLCERKAAIGDGMGTSARPL